MVLFITHTTVSLSPASGYQTLRLRPVDSKIFPPLLSLSTATTITHASNENIIIFQSISTASLPTVKLPDPAQSALTTGDCECDRAQRGDGLGSAHIKSLLSEGGSGPESCSNLHPHTRILF